MSFPTYVTVPFDRTDDFRIVVFTAGIGGVAASFKRITSIRHFSRRRPRWIAFLCFRCSKAACPKFQVQDLAFARANRTHAQALHRAQSGSETTAGATAPAIFRRRTLAFFDGSAMFRRASARRVLSLHRSASRLAYRSNINNRTSACAASARASSGDFFRDVNKTNHDIRDLARRYCRCSSAPRRGARRGEKAHERVARAALAQMADVRRFVWIDICVFDRCICLNPEAQFAGVQLARPRRPLKMWREKDRD